MNENNIHQELYWRDDFFLPLARILTASAALSVLVGIIIYMAFTTDMETIETNSTIVFAVISAIAIYDSFLGPQIAEKSRWYKAGVASSQARINSLESQLDDAYQRIDELTDKPSIASGTRNGQQILQVATDAHNLIRWHFGGHSIKRADCHSRGMGQQRWQRARVMLANADIYDSKSDQWKYTTFSGAAKVLQYHYKRRTNQSSSENVMTPL